MSLTTLELTAPLIFPLLWERREGSVTSSFTKCPHNEMTIAKETLRLYDPSTLFETQALME